MAQSEEKQEKSLLETIAGTLESELLEDAEVESKTEESVEEAAVFKVWGEDEDQDAEKDDVEDTSDEEEEESPVDEKEDDGIEGTEDPDEESDVKEDEHDGEEKEDEDEAEEAYHTDNDEDPSDEDSEDEDEVDTDDVEVSADDAESDMEDEAEDEAEDEEEAEATDDVLSGEEGEEMEEDEDDGIEGSEEPDSDASSAVDQIAQTVIKAATMKAKEKIEAEYGSMKEDIDALCAEDDSLTEEFKTKASAIFEAAVTSKVNAHIDQISEEFTGYVSDEIESVHEGLIEKIDSYLTYVAEEWINKNEVAVTNVLRTEIAESFMSSIKESFTDHYIEMPEGKTDMFDEVTQQNSELSESLKEKDEENKKLAEALVQLQKDAIVNELSEGLVATDAGKFKQLTKDIVFESKEEFTKKVTIIRESYFSKKTVESTEVKEETTSGNTTTHTVVEELDQTDDGLSPLMAKYIKASTRLESEAFGK